MGRRAVYKMKNQMKAWILFCLFLFILMGCQAEEATEKEADDNNTEPEQVYEHEGLKRYTEPVMLTMVGEMSDNLRGLEEQFPGETIRDNRWTALYEDVLGISIHYDWIVDSPFYHQRLANEIAFGKLPDV